VSDKRQSWWCVRGALRWGSHTFLCSVCQDCFELRSHQLGTCVPLCVVSGPWADGGKK